MSETLNDSDKAAKNAKMMSQARKVWMVLIPLFMIVILLNLYNWWTDSGSLINIVSPLGMIFLGLATIIGKEKKALYNILLGIAVILVLTGLILVILRFMKIS